MVSRPHLLPLLALGLAGCGRGGAPGPELLARFRADLAARAAAAEAQGRIAVEGRDGWLFLAAELESLAGEAAATNDADPVAAIVDFGEQLKRAGVDLLFVPVPAKAAVYPELLSEAVEAAPGAAPPRLDGATAVILERLRGRGVEVLDLFPALAARRLDPTGAAYCRQDTHWSSRGTALAAEAIAAALSRRPGARLEPRRSLALQVVEERRPIEGDLWRALPEPRPAREELQLLVVAGAPADDRSSPVLLLGDSHVLVFHAGGDLHATGAGLADHLAARLGFPLDVIGVRGSGAAASRLNLARRGPGALEGKRMVVWCLAARELARETGWQKVQVIR